MTIMVLNEKLYGLMQSLRMYLINCCFANWDSLRTRLNSHYKVRSYNKKKYNKIKTYKKSEKEHTDKSIS